MTLAMSFSGIENAHFAEVKQNQDNSFTLVVKRLMIT